MRWICESVSYRAPSLVVQWSGTYDLESVGDNSDSLELLSVVAAVLHERVGQSLNDGAVGLAESLGGPSTSGVGDVDGVAQGDVVTVGSDLLAMPASSPSAWFLAVDSNVRQGDVADLDIVVPLVEQLDVANLLNDILGKDVVESRALNLDIAAVGHVGCYAVVERFRYGRVRAAGS